MFYLDIVIAGCISLVLAFGPLFKTLFLAGMLCIDQPLVFWYVCSDILAFFCGFILLLSFSTLVCLSDSCLPLCWSILAFGLIFRQSGGEVVNMSFILALINY